MPGNLGSWRRRLKGRLGTSLPRVRIAITLVGIACGVGAVVLYNERAGSVVAIIAAIGVAYWLWSGHEVVRRGESVRGRKLLKLSDVAGICRDRLDERERGVLWGRMYLGRKDTTSHFCVVGAVGSGKTVTIRMLMRSQLPQIKSGSDTRALVYDPKQDMVQIVGSILEDSKSKCPMVILNPFDERACAWNIAVDIDTPAAARQFAETLVPTGENESQPFFSSAVRELLTAVVTVFARTRPGKWTLRDVLLVMKSKERIRQVLEPHSYTQDTARSFLDAGEVTVGSVLATVATKLGPYETIAAAWEKCKKQVSIKRWLTSESILILGNDERTRTILDTINQLFIAVVAQQALTMSESQTRRTWLYFDEFSEAGRLKGLESIILRGRSKGCCVVLGFQDISHVHDVYGEHLGNTLVGQCGNKAFLRIESPGTAEWASKSIGDDEAIEISRSRTKGAGGQNSTTINEQRQLRAVVLPSQFMELPVPGDSTRLHGYFILRAAGCYEASYSPEEFKQNMGPDTQFPAIVPAPVEWQYLTEWSDKDAVRLGIQSPPARRAVKPVDGLAQFDRLEL